MYDEVGVAVGLSSVPSIGTRAARESQVDMDLNTSYGLR